MINDKNRDEILKQYYEKCRLEFTWNIFHSKFKRTEYSEEMKESLKMIKKLIKVQETYLTKGVEVENQVINLEGEEVD